MMLFPLTTSRYRHAYRINIQEIIMTSEANINLMIFAYEDLNNSQAQGSCRLTQYFSIQSSRLGVNPCRVAFSGLQLRSFRKSTLFCSGYMS